jgi:CheY-like chemotaxis protein
VVEVMHTTAKLQEAIAAKKGHATLQQLAVQGGMRTMHRVAMDWVTGGQTTLVEVERVLGRELGADEEKDEGPTRVLLVDDDEGARRMMAALFAKESYEVVQAEDGQTGLDILAEDPGFSLVVLDLNRPGIDGQEVLTHIRGSVETAALPVLIRTGGGGVAMEAELLDAGADDYLEKSVGARRFLARVHAILRRAKL